MKSSINTSTNSFPAISGYSLVEQLYAGSRTAVYRAVQMSTQRPVVIKVLRREYPNLGELVQFRNQYTITKNLPIAGIVKPIGLESVGSGYAIVMEDSDGVSLRKYIQQNSLDTTEVLEIGIQIADILHGIIQHRVVHKDIKPANILIHLESKQVKLIDFSIASLLPKETQEIQSANILEGTLAYLAPEQTGRMNRGIDYRVDFYALGVTFYKLLTGTLPFTSDDPLELMHCHIAKVPVSVEQVNPDVPRMVAAIVTKLMAKNAEDRYQSALGLKYDLEQCLTQWKTTGEIAEFELGERDLSDRFLIPEKLYGREQEVQMLLQAFERAASGSSELMLVAGFSGIGKTAVVNEVHKPIVQQRGYFIKGKFDQFNRNIPLSAFVKALRDLMGQLLSESDDQLAQWKTQILAALGENGRVLIDVIPELEQIIGKQPIAPELSGSAAQNRFNLLFQKFIELFTTAEHPLVLFLDDLQWADLASLQLLKLLMNDNGYLLLLGAYRDNEVSPSHPFMMTVAELQKAQNVVNTITLKPLAFEDTNHLVADTLNCSTTLAQPLTELVDRKTQGNPFFTTQFLKALHEDGQISFDRDRRYWECDIAQVNALALTDDVVEFMALQLQKLSAETQQVLKLAACIGNQFDLTTLAIAAERLPVEAATALWKALQEGLILPTSQVYKFFQDAEQIDVQNSANPTYRFLHDRVQQAAYTLIPESQKQQTHLKIGRLLLNHPSNAGYLFEILSHFNNSIDLITEAKERRTIAQLNLAGCLRAKASTAYSAAIQYANSALSLLPPDAWQADYAFTLELYEAAAEANYSNIEFDTAKTLIQTVFQHSKDTISCIQSHKLLLQIYSTDEQLKAVETGLELIAKLGVPLIDGDWQQALPQLPTLADLPSKATMTQSEYLAALQILITIAPPAHRVKPEIFPVIVLTMVQLCERGGYSAPAAYAYGFYGLLCTVMGDLKAAHHAGQVSLALLDQYQSREWQTKVLILFAVFVCACKEPGQNTLPLLRQGIESGLEVGNIEYVSYYIKAYFPYLFLLGLPLAIIEDARQIYLPILIQFKQEDCINFTNIWLWLTDEFIGGNRLSEMAGTDVQQHLEITHNYQALYAFHLANLISGYTFGNYSLAVGHAALALKSEDAAYGILMSAAHNFYYSLALLALIPSTQSPCELELDQVIANQQKLRHLANHAPSNFLHKLQLVEAEIYRVQGHRSEAIESYECAIATAKANQFIQEEALANELAAKFYLDWGKEKVAAGYMQEAYYGYARWGAKAKTDDLESRYPQLLRPILQAAAQSLNVFETLASIAAPNITIHSSTNISSSSSSSFNTVLDFAAIIKASQSLAGTIQLDELLHQLTHIILQNSGGDRCALILPNSGKEWSVVAIATPTTTELCAEPIEGNAKLPVKLIQYVKNTQEVVIVDEGKTELPVIGQYLSQHQPKSVLCLPILNQAQLMGILYLENSATSNVFTRDRIVILNFLCTQAAISITNAQLYAEKVKYTYTLEKEVAERTSELQCANEELYRLATIDGLTQVANRRHFDKQLDLEWERLKREQLPLSLILFDVDYFKRYNDCYGHQAGDTCLIQVAQAATEGVCRAGDLVARYGGEEFVIVLPNTDLQGAIATAKRIQQALRAKAVPHERSEVSNIVSISLGITSVIPCSQLSPKMLISTADEALYVAKQQGRDRYAIGEIGVSLDKSD